MKYTPIFVPVFLALLIIGSTIYKPPMPDPTMAAPPDGTTMFLQNVQAALRDAKTLRIFKFPAPCQKCHNAKLSVQDFPDLPPATQLTSADTQFFVTKLSEPSSYVPGGAQKPMPFIADHGLLLEGASELRILLLSTYSQSVRLITSNRDGGVLIGNIDPVFPEVKDRLARIFK